MIDSLYSRSEQTIAQCIIAGVPLDRLIRALAVISDEVLKAERIPTMLRPRLLLRAHQILRGIENEQKLLDLCFAEYIPHPECKPKTGFLGELWELPLEDEWLCGDCGKPLYGFRDKNS